MAARMNAFKPMAARAYPPLVTPAAELAKRDLVVFCDGAHPCTGPSQTCYSDTLNQGYGGYFYVGCCTTTSCAARTVCFDYQSGDPDPASKCDDVNTGGCTTCTNPALPSCVVEVNDLYDNYVMYCDQVGGTHTAGFSETLYTSPQTTSTSAKSSSSTSSRATSSTSTKVTATTFVSSGQTVTVTAIATAVPVGAPSDNTVPSVSHETLGSGAIAGIAVGGAFGLAALIALLLSLCSPRVRSFWAGICPCFRKRDEKPDIFRTLIGSKRSPDGLPHNNRHTFDGTEKSHSVPPPDYTPALDHNPKSEKSDGPSEMAADGLGILPPIEMSADEVPLRKTSIPQNPTHSRKVSGTNQGVPSSLLPGNRGGETLGAGLNSPPRDSLATTVSFGRGLGVSRRNVSPQQWPHWMWRPEYMQQHRVRRYPSPTVMCSPSNVRREHQLVPNSVSPLTQATSSNENWSRLPSQFPSPEPDTNGANAAPRGTSVVSTGYQDSLGSGHDLDAHAEGAVPNSAEVQARDTFGYTTAEQAMSNTMSWNSSRGTFMPKPRDETG